ncbi:hypothetical protein [Natrinema marinum]|uniref:hypothetical protein n=1 Tax=Natrinema marinum TaxID=2961598 RepID=UPI0020C87A31|nr:hypothetical protein [Natrinema marinum]
MVSVDRTWVALGVVVAVTYVVSLAFWGLWATQGAAFAAAAVGVALGSLLWLAEQAASRMDWSDNTPQDSSPD